MTRTNKDRYTLKSGLQNTAHKKIPLYSGISEFTMRNGGRLPHWQEPGAYYYVTFCIRKGRMLSEKSKDIVYDSLLNFDKMRYRMISFVIMTDHCHAILHPLPKKDGAFWDISHIIGSIKKFTSRKINEIEHCEGDHLWQKESYDRIIREDKEMEKFLEYIDYNAIKAGMSDEPQKYKWYYLTEDWV